MKLKYIGILRRDGSAPIVNDGDNIIKPDENNVIEVGIDLGESLIASNLWEAVGKKSKAEEPAQDEVDETQIQEEPKAEEPAQDEGSAQDKAALIAYAKSLGIKATANWGIEKLNTEIAKATAEAN